MSILAWILLAGAAGGVLSVALALVALAVRAEWIPAMVSYAIGALLGATFLEILPHAFELAGDVQHLSAVILGGLLGFFLLEKLVLWRHCHAEACEAHGGILLDHGHGHGRSGLMIMVGDTFHNFVDGVMIAAAFLVDVQLGVVTALAIIAHEIPQELGDFLILLHSGYSRARALSLNLLSSVATLVGATLGYFALHEMRAVMPYVLAVAASGMIYVAVADLIPGLHKRAALRHTVEQILLIGLGVATVWAAGTLAEGWLGDAGSYVGMELHGHQ
jgi:zinc and cadmium transporter